MKKTLFISDLHLDTTAPAMAETFRIFFNSIDSDVDAVYILGDLFESWIGDDDQSDFNISMINAIKSATEKGTPVFLLHGNRDFLLGKRFMQMSGCQYLPDETVVNIYGTPTLLMHGDTLCTRDITYLKSRKWLRNSFIQWLFLHLPLSTRRSLANSMRMKSQQHIKSASADIMDVTHSEVIKVMQKHHALNLIHGHTHRMAIHQFTIDNAPAARMVLGAWHQRGNMLCWTEDGRKSLIEINNLPDR